jgi:zinc and cadmium transporter
MIILYIILLFATTLIGATLPIWFSKWKENNTSLLLAFSGTFLLGITIMHLIPESLHHHSQYAPLLIVGGFFAQLVLQRLTHGLEHGHIHHDATHHHNGLRQSFILGLAIHAFSEGIPLGIVYLDNATLPSIFLAIAVHKIPEAMLLTVMLLHLNTSINKTIFYVAGFSLITPVAVLFTQWMDLNTSILRQVIGWCMPLVAGSFLQISTTVLYESGTKHHQIKKAKWIAILSGILLSIISFLVTEQHVH